MLACTYIPIILYLQTDSWISGKSIPTNPPYGLILNIDCFELKYIALHITKEYNIPRSLVFVDCRAFFTGILQCLSKHPGGQGVSSKSSLVWIVDNGLLKFTIP